MDFHAADAIRQQILADNDPITASVILGQMLSDDSDFYAALHGRELAPGIHVRNPGPDPDRMTRKLIARVSQAGDDYVDGMRNPRRDPVQAAVRAEGKYENNVKTAIAEKRYGKGVRGQDYQEAVRIATEDGGVAFVSGVTRRESKIRRVFGDLAPRLGAVSQAIQAMPQDTEQQREQRLLAARRAMIAVGKARRGAGGGST